MSLPGNSQTQPQSLHKYELAAGGHVRDRTMLSTRQIVEDIWNYLNLPANALNSLTLPGQGHILPSSFRIADIAQASIALSALAAALVHSTQCQTLLPSVSVDRFHAVSEFASERLYTIDGKPAESGWGPLGGLYRAKDGYVRMHDGFPNLSKAATEVLGLLGDATKDQVAEKVLQWKADELEEVALENKAVIYKLRTYKEWDATTQSGTIPDWPITLRRIGDNEVVGLPHLVRVEKNHSLDGLRVLDLSRVIAAPVAGRTLAAHGADVLWITSPVLPGIPAVDKDTSRGKRTVHLDLQSTKDYTVLEDLLKDADVFIQSYRPGSLSARGLTSTKLAELRPGIVVGNLSTWGTEGPWQKRRGFDSIVQTVAGMNHSEWLHCGEGETPARPLPVQALDHAAGYFLATGIVAALHRRAAEGSSWEVNVSLAAVMKYLRSLGQLPGRLGFEGEVKPLEECLIAAAGDPCRYKVFEEAISNFGMMKVVKHAAVIEDLMPKSNTVPHLVGTDKPIWL